MTDQVTERQDAAVPAEADRPDELGSALAELASLLMDEVNLDGMLERVVHLAARSIPDCDSAGVTLVVDGRPTTAAATDSRTLAVDSAQYVVGAGPCLESYRVGAVQRIDVAKAGRRYPDFAAAAREAGIRSFLAAPLMVRDHGIGALNLYAAEPHGFAELDEAVVTSFAGQAAVAVANSQLYEGARTLAGQLREAMSSRAVIEQAKGVLMATYAIDDEGAFERLRRASQVENRKLRAVATDVVAAAVAGRPVVLRD